MRPKALLACAALAIAFGAELRARDPTDHTEVDSKQILIEALAADPSKQVNAQLYTFPPGVILPWHIHPDADEIAYVLEGDFAFQIEGGQERALKPGEATYLAPNLVHRGMNKGKTPVKLFVVRIKPEDKPLVQEVPAPQP